MAEALKKDEGGGGGGILDGEGGRTTKRRRESEKAGGGSGFGGAQNQETAYEYQCKSGKKIELTKSHPYGTRSRYFMEGSMDTSQTPAVKRQKKTKKYDLTEVVIGWLYSLS
mmetsp:Transcript_66027/g.162544  ORF Transcript_66027/g.162544 Transcript_66027/m.162544 type:complete len:112 (-) Transcript_66027:145-480(-)